MPDPLAAAFAEALSKPDGLGTDCQVCGQSATSPRGRLKRHGKCAREDGLAMSWGYDR